jgi:hypothetical protein
VGASASASQVGGASASGTQVLGLTNAVVERLRAKGYTVPNKSGSDVKDTRAIWLGDTATSHHVIGNAQHVVGSQRDIEPIDMWTAAGLETVVTEVTSYVEGFGEVSGLHMPLSPNLLSVGVKVEDEDEYFIWSKKTGPRLYPPGTEINLPEIDHMQFSVEDKVPVYCGAMVSNHTSEHAELRLPSSSSLPNQHSGCEKGMPTLEVIQAELDNVFRKFVQS